MKISKKLIFQPMALAVGLHERFGNGNGFIRFHPACKEHNSWAEIDDKKPLNQWHLSSVIKLASLVRMECVRATKRTHSSESKLASLKWPEGSKVLRYSPTVKIQLPTNFLTPPGPSKI